MSSQFVGVQNSNLSPRSSSIWRPCTPRTTERGRSTTGSIAILVTRCIYYGRPSGQTLNQRVKEHKKALTSGDTRPGARVLWRGGSKIKGGTKRHRKCFLINHSWGVWSRNVIITALSLYNQAIKSLGTERSSDQGRFSKILDPGLKRFYRRRVCDYPLQLHDGLYALHDWMIVPCTAAVSLKINLARLQGGSSEPPWDERSQTPLATGLDTSMSAISEHTMHSNPQQ